LSSKYSILFYLAALPFMLPKIILFVGYPGSGKSTLARHISEHSSAEEKTLIISQDIQRRSGMYTAFNDNLKNSTRILLDNCHLTAEKRREFLEMALSKNIWCVYMNFSWEECAYRVAHRKNHPTVKGDGKTIMQTVKDQLEPPSLAEGYEKLFILSKDSEVEHFLAHELKLPAMEIAQEPAHYITKFPRTRHLSNLGSATRDDLIFSPEEQKKLLQCILYLEEKLDGANLGISISADYKIRAQNRSHYVTSSYHAQFKPLDKWLNSHSNELFALLQPEEEILYGEWLNFKHSIHYTNLPDYFLAFDLYNVKTKSFLSREALEKRLADSSSSIKIVPLLAKQSFKDLQSILQFLKQKSNYSASNVEGVYVRACQGDLTVNRAKIVRNDFISGDQHWTKGKYVENKIILQTS
jgi:atypical dual specificity phosphatase